MSLMVCLYLVGVLAGLFALWKGGDWVVHYAIQASRAFKVSSFFFGFIVLALAAAVPELALAIIAGLGGVGEVSAGDIVGANFTDVALVVGVVLSLSGAGFSMSKNDRHKIVRMLALGSLVMLLAFISSPLTYVHGIVLIALYCAVVAWAWYNRKAHDIIDDEVSSGIEHDAEIVDHTLVSKWGVMVKLGMSIVGVMFASYLTVQCATQIGLLMGMKLETLGATLLAVGTSLPELSMSLSALRRKEYNLAIGPTLGTVFEQATLILGILLVCSPKPISLGSLGYELAFMFGAFSLICYGLLFRPRLSRSTGFSLVGLFVLYFVYQFSCGGLAC